MSTFALAQLDKLKKSMFMGAFVSILHCFGVHSLHVSSLFRLDFHHFHKCFIPSISVSISCRSDLLKWMWQAVILHACYCSQTFVSGASFLIQLPAVFYCGPLLFLSSLIFVNDNICKLQVWRRDGPFAFAAQFPSLRINKEIACVCVCTCCLTQLRVCLILVSLLRGCSSVISVFRECSAAT